MAEVDKLLTQVIELDASDLHLTPGVAPTVRVYGRLKPLGDKEATADTVKKMIYELLTEPQKQRLEHDLELDFSYAMPGKARFRVNGYWQRGTLSAAFRLVPLFIKTPEELGLPAIVADLAERPRGFVLVTGPTGCGKSTTLASMLDIINKTRSTHIVTVEDPIEFLHQHNKSIVNQREVGADTHSFAAALRHILRQDPDVILIGEMRDLETIAIALTAAETGHLVFATLHTQDAPQSIDRIIDVFPPQQQHQIKMQLSGTLQAILAQQLLPQQNQSGLVPAVEVMVATPGIRNMIREGKTHQIYSAMQAGYNVGMQTMDQALANLCRQQKISYEDALQRCIEPETFKRLMGKA